MISSTSIGQARWKRAISAAAMSASDSS